MVIRLEVYNGATESTSCRCHGDKADNSLIGRSTIETRGVGGGGRQKDAWKGAFGS